MLILRNSNNYLNYFSPFHIINSGYAKNIINVL